MTNLTDLPEIDPALLATLAKYFRACRLPWPAAHAEDAVRAGITDTDAFVWREVEGVQRLASALLDAVPGSARAMLMRDLQAAVGRLGVLCAAG